MRLEPFALPSKVTSPIDKEARENAKAEGIQPLDVMIAMIKQEIEAGIGSSCWNWC